MYSKKNGLVEIVGDDHIKAFKVCKKDHTFKYALIEIIDKHINVLEFFHTVSDAKFHSMNLDQNRKLYVTEVNKWCPWIDPL